MSIGFCIGALIIGHLSPAWGFYLVVILLAFFLLVNVIAPETRRAPYRRSIAQYVDEEEKLKRRVARGEVKLHISNDGPKWWFQEVWAGIILTKRMMSQPGFFILALYLAWMYAQVTLVILVGHLLSICQTNADRAVVARCLAFSRLQLATALCWVGGIVCCHWCTAGCATVQSQPFQSISRSPTAY